MRKNTGITLIALIVTIIILLILSGVAIISLTGEEGLINKVSIARKNQLESETKEKLKLKIMELQADIVQKERKTATLEDLNKWTDLESDYYDREIKNVIDNQENSNKIVEMDEYAFEIDQNLNIISIMKSNFILKTETTYQINSINEDKMEITIKIKNSSGIEKIITPEGREIISQGNKTQIAIDYEVISGNNYVFKVKNSDSKEIKEYILKADINAKPEIEQNESYAYPILTEYGVEVNKPIEIDYGDNTNNYYSIDNGETWKKYTDTVNIKKECTLLAKSIIDGEITRETKKEITIELANDALGRNAYDTDLETYYTGNIAYIEVSEEMCGKTIRIKYAPASPSYLGWIHYYDSLSEEIGTETRLKPGLEEYDIPENTAKIALQPYNAWGDKDKIYEIQICDEPIISGDITVYPVINKNGIEIKKGYAKIEYEKKYIQKLYKVNDGQWIDYNNTNIELQLGDTIYVKGIDKFGNESVIVSDICRLANDALGRNAYDTDLETYYTGNTAYIEVSEEMCGKTIRIKYAPASSSYLGWIHYYDSLSEEIGTETRLKPGLEKYDIPENTAKIALQPYNAWGDKDKIYEIQICDE